jgi:cold shock CspA family protein
MNGTIVKVVTTRGFGFIRPDGAARDVYFHASSLDESLPFDERLSESRVSFTFLENQAHGKSAAIDIKPEN